MSSPLAGTPVIRAAGRRRPSIVAVAALASCVIFGWISTASVRTVSRPLTIGALLDIRHPSDATWSPNGKRVAFLWERAGVQNVWVVDLDSGSAKAPRSLTQYDEGLVQSLFWRPDSGTVFFMRDGDLWRAAADGSTGPVAVWTTPEAESGVTLSPDGTQVAFSRRGDIWRRS